MIGAIKRMLGIGPKPDYAALAAEGAVILDVRTKREYSTGHIKGSVNIPVENLAGNLDRLKEKDRPIITCCASGMRSGTAKKLLRSKGYSQVYNGGGWFRLQNKLK